jgi:hypothetical protein
VVASCWNLPAIAINEYIHSIRNLTPLLLK